MHILYVLHNQSYFVNKKIDNTERKKDMNKFKVGDVAMYKDKLVHIVNIQETHTKHKNLFGEHDIEYRYVVEEDGDNLQNLVWEYEMVEIKNLSSYLIVPRKENTDSIDATPARMLAAMIIDHMPELNELEDDAYYKCEDELTEFINEYKYA